MTEYNNTFVIFQAEEDIKSFSFDKLRKILNDLGLEEKSIDNGYSNPKFVWFRYITSNNIKKINMYHINPIYCINMLEGNACITDKYLLYNNMKKFYPEEINNFMPESFKLTVETKYKPGDIYIARPVNNIKTKLRASSGLDVIVYNSNQSLISAKKLLLKYDNVIVSKYITNPLLFNDKKFHLRAYMMVTLFNGVYSSYMFDICRIMLSKNKFNNTDYQNKDIHDTHYRYNDDDYLFPIHFTSNHLSKNINDDDIIDILYKIKDICYKMSDIYSYNVKLKSNSKNGFHLFGFDIMIDENFNPMLIECNRFQNTGLDYNQEMKKLFENYFIEWLNETVVKPLFKPETKSETTFITKPLYQKL